jgi:hypothetical protein
MEKRICQYCGRDEECDLEQGCPLSTPPKDETPAQEADAKSD